MSPFRQVEAGTVREWIKNGDLTIVDIRDEGSFKEEHIPGAVSVQKDNLDAFLEVADRDKVLVCYCYHGISSQSAARYFSEQGFKKVYSLVGGYEHWRGSGE